MARLQKRLLDILAEFLKADTVLNQSYLSKTLGVSKKTIQNDIKALNDVVQGYGAVIESQRGKGYELKVREKEVFEAFCRGAFNEDHKNVPDTHEGRVSYILTRLLTARGYLKLDDFADELYVSKSTVHLIMKDVTDILGRYKLSVEQRPYYGIRVRGDEFSIRLCLSQHLYARDEGIRLLKHDPHLEEDLLQSDLPIRDTILEGIRQTDIFLSDMELDNLVIHIAIAIRRLKESHYIKTLRVDLSELKETAEFGIAKTIIQKLEEALSISFPEEETAYVAIHLLGTKVVSRTEKNVHVLLGDEVNRILNKILESIRASFGIDFTQDQELRFGLGLHLKTLLNRVKYGLNLRNPLLGDIKNSYPYAFEIALAAAKELSHALKRKINENETGYLAIHFGAALSRNNVKDAPKRCLLVCATGLGSAQLLKYKIEELFGEKIQIIGTTGYYQLKVEDIWRQNIDFIISTIHIPVPLPIPVIKVNTIFQKQDAKAIRKQLLLENNEDILEYIQDNLIFLQQDAETQEEVIRFLYEKVKALGLVPEEFYESVLKREEASSTAFGNLVAVPHPIRPLSTKTFLAFCTLKKPVMWGNQQVQFICLLCVEKNNKQDLEKIYDLLYNIMNKASVVEEFVNITDISAFKQKVLECQHELI